MKVLFAVNNDDISEKIIKKYQKEYKEILSYKNVYYFNAILKELQKDKTYDRVVISEDLEPFANNNYDTIDKFIFDKLDSISDETTDAESNDTDIILICVDRRTKSDEMLVKLFGLGIYNAIIGQDRSIAEVCRLINKPRSKKDAKQYYKIETENVNYQPENENNVSEVEVQNILEHYRRLGKNEDKYVDSFNSIVSQYNDNQLKIIIRYLPIGVKAVLEERSPKYQELITFGPNQKIEKTNNSNIKNGAKKEPQGRAIQEKMIEKASLKNKMTKPIVIPEGVNKSNVKKLIKETPKIEEKIQLKQKTVEQNSINKIEKTNTNKIKDNVKKEMENKKTVKIMEPIVEDIVSVEESPVQKRGRGRPKKILTPEEIAQKESKPKRGRGRPKKNIEPQEIKEQENEEEIDLFTLNEEIEETNNVNIPNQVEDEEEIDLFGLDEEDEETTSYEENEDEIDLFGLDEEEEENESYEDEDEDEIDLFGLDEEENESYEEEDEDEVDLSELDEEDEEDLFELDEDEEESESYEEDDEIDLFELDDEEENESYEEEDDDEIDLSELDADDDETDLFDDEEEEEINLSEEDDDYSYNNEEQKNEIIPTQYSNNNSNFSTLLTKDKKVVSFVGTTKNGTSFVVNNLATMLASTGISTAVLDTTKSKNAYYIYTNNENALMQAAKNSIYKLKSGIAEGIKVNKNLSIFTGVPEDDSDYSDVDSILSTLVQSFSVVLIDCDFDTPDEYFRKSQEIYLVQSMDVLTIQPLTAFLRNLQSKGILKQEKLKIVINKGVKIKSVSVKALIGGISNYNDPSMSFMKNLFEPDKVPYCIIPFEEQNYIKYLDSLINCSVTLNGYSKTLISALNELSGMVYPLLNKQTYSPRGNRYNDNFSNDVNDTLNKMKKKYQ